MTANKDDKVNYGNWVPAKLVVLLWVGVAVLAIGEILNIVIWNNLIAHIVLAIAIVVVLFFAINMQLIHNAVSVNRGNLMGKMHDFILEHLNYEGEGKIMDIGCGSGSLAIRCGKALPKAHIIGMDYWGAVWSFAKEQCENNARIEGVSNVEFIKGDATNIDCADGELDGAVSNFVFHEVRTESDKRKLVREALRIIKKGGKFAFQDMFEEKRLYGDMQEFVEELKAEGCTDVQYIPHTENLPFVPKSIKVMFKDTGLLYGTK